jgi:16S rRNA (guanine527-N7)-methyltransferase
MFKREILDSELKKLGIEDPVINGKIYQYRELILSWNEKINLTSITEEEDMYIKHFIDSYMITKIDIKLKKKRILDVGTGAGFPGIPLALLYKDASFTLVDSLNKRINFLEIVKSDLSLDNVELIHARAEDLAKDADYRQQFDVVLSRAVADLSVLLEYTLPFVRIGGHFIAYKGSNYKREMGMAENALDILGGEIVKVVDVELPILGDLRSFIIVEKVKDTPFRYPRKPGKAAKNPL